MRIDNQRHVITVSGSDLPGSVFRDVSLAGSVLDDVDLSAVTIGNANLAGARFLDCNLLGATIEGVLVSELFAAYRAQSAGETTHLGTKT
jgi:uncharacterized protein YjbI with pentapeptide repeats